jgi:tetratricopeptide (TPR) repeat protein
MFRRVAAPEHPNIASGLVSLARVIADRGDLGAAEDTLREAVDMNTRLLGANHWRTARARGFLAAVWREQGRVEESEQALRGVLALLADGSGQSATQVAIFEVELGRTLIARGEATAAETLLRGALMRQIGLYPSTSWRLATVKSLLGEALLRQNRWSEAEHMLEQARAVLPNIGGPRGREARLTRDRMVRLYQATGRPELAGRLR